MAEHASVESPAEFGKDSEAEYKRWIAEINAAMKPEEKFRTRAKEIEERYLDEKDQEQEQLRRGQRRMRRFNILWSNTEILKAALYANDPKPIIERRYRDQDPIGRQAGQVLDRVIRYLIDQTRFSETVKAAVFDATLPGRGVARVRYVPEYGPPQQGIDGNPFRPVVYEEAKAEYTHWSDFLTSPARNWEQVRWVSFRALMTRNQGVEQFGQIFYKVPLTWPSDDKQARQRGERDTEIFKRAEVFEIWDRQTKTVNWLGKDFTAGLLRKVEDPLRLKGFFPCPEPLSFTRTNSDIIPRAEYDLYRDQAEEIDTLTTRINNLIKAIRVAGIYDASNKELQQFLTAVENTMTPIENWQGFAEKGGLKGAVDWLPIDMIVASLVQLAEARERIKQELYEVTGIGDIIRGASDPDETATAQRIKGRFAGLRLQDKQARVASFVRDLIELMAEVVAEHFAPETLKLMTSLQMPDEPIVQQPPVLMAAE